MKINCIELEMLKYLRRRKYVPQWRFKMNFPIFFHKATNSLIVKNLITREHLDGEPYFIQGTTIPIPGSGRFTITVLGQEFIDNLRKERYSSVWKFIKNILQEICAAIIGIVITYLWGYLVYYFT